MIVISRKGYSHFRQKRSHIFQNHLKVQPKFIVDENLSPELASILRSKGFEAFHINESKGDRRRILDPEITAFAQNEDLAILTSDHDFVRSYFKRGIPPTVVFFHGNLSRKNQIALLDNFLDELLLKLPGRGLFEVSENGVRVP